MTTENISKQADFSAIIEVYGRIGTFVKATKTVDIPLGKMKHIDVQGVEILIANVDGKFYAVCDRCPHLNAVISEGTLNKTIVTCPRHLSSFDVTTGKVISGTRSNLQTYDVKVIGNNIFVDIG